MSNPFCRSLWSRAGVLAPVVLVCLATLFAAGAHAQTSTTPSGLDKQLSRIDFAVSAAGEFGTRVSGIEQRDANTTHSLLSIRPSSTVGELVTLRYTAKPYVGFELNVSNLRYTQDYTFTPPPATNILLGGAQSGVREMSLGYVAHIPHKFYRVQAFAGAGGGTIKFTPTPYGGQGLPFQYRAAYYYQAGLEDNFPDSHFGMRLAFRQVFSLAPDFGQNYLTITRRTITSEPTIGFFVRF